MIFVPKIGRSENRRKEWSRRFLLVALTLLALPATSGALPTRLVLALDGVAYRDMQALQAGVTRTNFWGKKFQRRAFTAEEGYFPVSRMISTFPSLSDIAWTDIFGDRPLPGYQRIYFSRAANAEIVTSGISTTMEYEQQMDWQVESSFRRGMGYLFPMHAYEYEVRQMSENFWQTTSAESTYYAYVRASDDAQHLDRNIFVMLCRLDRELQNLRARYKTREGRDLQIVILSDHGHNHAGRGRRFAVGAFLERAGYRIAKTIVSSKDVVLPDGGIEDWAEINSAPAETENLARLLCHLKGVDVLTAPVPNQTNRFLVMNSRSERADIDWNPANNSFRYATVNGDPLDYRPVVEALSRNHQLDADGFATADAWMAATMTNHYPLAPERIVRGLTRNILNPATILISLNNHYVNDGWLTHQGSRLVTCGSTHGALDDLNSDGILLSNFAPTRDTSSGRVAGQFENFPNVKDFRAQENGAEWVTKKEQAQTRIARVPFDRDFTFLPGDGVYLRIWSPEFAGLDGKATVEVAIEKISSLPIFSSRRGHEEIALNPPLSQADPVADERIYALPADLHLEPQTEYRISGWIQKPKKTVRLFKFPFHTNPNGEPAAY
jgi:hypothetical protein